MNKYTALLDNPTLVARFWNRVDKTSSPFGCWLWTGPANSQGSGYLRLPDGTMLMAHRVVYELTFKPTGKYRFNVRRSCGNLLCVNPDHMEFGPQLSYRRDKDGAIKSPPRGEAHYRAKLTEADVREMRRLHADGVIYLDLAARYGITPLAAWKAVRGKNWSHVV